MKMIYEKNRHDPPWPKNMPETSGKIAWARSIISRIKAPIDKFKTKPEILTNTAAGRNAALNYVRLAKELTEEYENKLIFDKWVKENSTAVLVMLKEHILRPETVGGRKTFRVNFDPKLKVIIREAKFLDRIGKKDIPDTIINIALQEKDYARHIDKLNQLLRSYDSVLMDLKPIEQSLLTNQIGTLNGIMRKGVENHNWFSLSIPEYIKECNNAIEKFKEVKTRVVGHSINLQKKIENIENAVLIKPITQSMEVMELQEFSDYFELHRVKVVQDLVHDYEEITNFLKQIEQTAFETPNQDLGCHPDMKKYY